MEDEERSNVSKSKIKKVEVDKKQQHRVQSPTDLTMNEAGNHPVNSAREQNPIG